MKPIYYIITVLTLAILSILPNSPFLVSLLQNNQILSKIKKTPDHANDIT